MNAAQISSISVDSERRNQRFNSGARPASTSIRVSTATRDALAAEAQAAGLSLSGYLDRTVRQAQRQRAFADFRAAAIEAYRDPGFTAEIQEWDEADDGIDFDDERPDDHD